MEKTFLALKNRKAREAYVEAELVNGLAHQIRILRQQRGWTQTQLAAKLGTTQTTISRLEDPSYGRYTMRTLLALCRVFDVAFFVRFMPFSKFVSATWDTRPEHFEAATYEDEATSVQFFTENRSGPYVIKVITSSTQGVADYAAKRVIGEQPSYMPSGKIQEYLNYFSSNFANNETLPKTIKRSIVGE